MQYSSRMRRGLWLLFVLASACILQAAPASGACIPRQHHLIAKGRSVGGNPWTVTGTVRNNASCKSWLFGMDFVLSDTLAGSWNWNWGIPAGGHLSNKFTISGGDEVEGFSERAFSGTAGARVKTIVLTMSNGERVPIHPKLPPLVLRRRFVWLRNVCYFVYYYPSGRRLKVATLRNSRGEIIEKVWGSEGEFQGL